MRAYFPLPDEYQRITVAANGTWHREVAAIPEIGPRDLLFKLIAAGIQPGDRSPSGTRRPSALPVGEVAAVGDALNGWNPLDRGLIVPEEAGEVGLGEFLHWRSGVGGAPEPYKLPESISAEDATLLPAAAEAARILRKAGLPPGGSLLVVGLGLVGQILLLLARHQRIERIAAADPSPTLRAKAEYSGATRLIRIPEEALRDPVLAETAGHGVHAAVLLTPDPHWLGEASRLLAPRGALLVASEFPAGFTLNIAPAWVRRHEIRVQGVRGFSERDLREAIRAIGQGIVNAENLVSRRISWAEVDSADLTPGTWDHATHVVVLGPDS